MVEFQTPDREVLCSIPTGSELYSPVCWFELSLNIPVNSYGHVGTLPPIYGTFTHVITLKMFFKLIITTQVSHKGLYMYMYGWFDLNHLSWAGSDQSRKPVIR